MDGMGRLRGNVALVSHNARCEGAPIMTLRIGGALRSRGWRVTMVSLADGELSASFDAVLPPEAAARLAAERGCSHVLLNTVVSASFAATFRKHAPGAAILGVFHEMRVPHFPWYTAAAAEDLHGAVFVSESCAATYRDLFGPATPFLVTHNWLDAATRAAIDAAPRLDPEARRELGAGGLDVLVLSVGSVVPHKGQLEFVLGAFAPAARADPRLRLALLGTVYDPAAVERIVAACPPGSVTVTGLLPPHRAARYVRAADATVQNSLMESFCLAAHEALYAGVPVMATAVGGLAEQIVHGETGLLHRVGDMAAAAEHLRALAADGALRERMGAAARARVLRDYGEAGGVAVYEEAVRRTKAAPRGTRIP